MRNYKLFIVFIFLVPEFILAQNIPADSPKSTLIQRVGLSDITITYSRPGVKGRIIFGSLIPYGQVWRTGADYPTFIHLSDTTYFGEDKEMAVPSKYALYSIPEKERWTIILSKDTLLWGAFGYKQENDALRFDVIPDNSSPFAETFNISFVDVEDDKANILLHWENTKVVFPVFINIYEKVLSYIVKQIESSEKVDWGLYWKGAKFLLKQKKEQALALEWINKSVDLDGNWFNLWTKAEILAWCGKYEDAVKVGNLAIEDGTSEKNKTYFPYEQVHKQEIEKWKHY